jgi:hypothetical protein
MGFPPIALQLQMRPEDSLLAMPAALSLLRGEGWQTVSLLLDRCGRTSRQLGKTARRQGIILLEPRQPLQFYEGVPDHEQLYSCCSEILQALQPQLVVSPSLQDVYPAYGMLGKAAQLAMESHRPALWWQWQRIADQKADNLHCSYQAQQHKQLRLQAKQQGCLAEFSERSTSCLGGYQEHWSELIVDRRQQWWKSPAREYFTPSRVDN